MPVLDVYLPDDLPISADADLGRDLALVVDAATIESAAPCLVYVHRLPIFGVVSAEVEGVRAVRVQVSCEAGPWLDLGPGLEDVVRTYLRSLRLADPTRIVVSVQAVSESNAVGWPVVVGGLAG